MQTFHVLAREWRNYQETKAILDKLYQQVLVDSKNINQGKHMSTQTEAQKAQVIADAYNAQKAQLAKQAQQIAALQTQVNNGTPATADQIAALAILDTTATEVESDEAAAGAPGDANTPPVAMPTTPSAPSGS